MMEQVLFTIPFWRSLLTLVIAALVVMGSPGPATMSVAAVAASAGPRRALPYTAGVAAGTLAVLMAVAAGVGSLLLSLPRLAPVLMAMSIAYLLYLAYRIATAPPLSASGVGTGSHVPSPAAGVLLGVANPKAYAAIGAVFASVTLPLEPALVRTVVTTGALAVMVVLIHLGWLLAGAVLSRPMRHPVAARFLNLAFATALVLAALWAVAG